MPKMLGAKEKIHQPIWDHLIRVGATTVPAPIIGGQTRLFSGFNTGQLQWTNMTQAGSLSSDATYVILALRVWTHFRGVNALDMYHLTTQQMFCTLRVGDKNYFQWPAWYTPAGGGTWGFDSTQPLVNNGTPEQTATMRLGKPISIPARQAFTVLVDLFDIENASLRTTFLNSGAVGAREIAVVVDGLYTRDVG